MTARIVATAARLPLWWAKWYTLGLPAPVRQARRAEIASDTYEHLRDPLISESQWLLVRDCLRSVVAGIPDDLTWRASYVSAASLLWQAAAVGALPGVAALAIVYHFTSNSLAALAAALAVALITATSLKLLSSKDVTMVSQPSRDSISGGRRSLEPVAGLIAFALILVAMMVIPWGGDPADPNELVENASSHTDRWANGYLTYSAGLAFAIIAMHGIGRLLRQHGQNFLGTAVGPLFTLGAAGSLVAQGALGIGLGATLDAGMDGEAYLNDNGWPSLFPVSFATSLLEALAMLAVAVGIWRSGILGGWQRMIAAGAFVVLAISFALFLEGVSPLTLILPAAGLVAFGLLTWRTTLHRASSPAPTTRPTSPVAQSP